ncbi:oligopeptide:H+ symporter [Porticoccaceae bacterium]|nr:oligopeptide:H+ symporter [Porticoccaceae bacterium]MDA7850006.1 oligopeptide:H+ symporter [Porticoccaceae bacterium]MDA8598508.1 oligopeptide:H+ symporter [Porticoccaceae bacterium]MDA8878747.1 oligopeptide:H+ symporter [Porticoccaceae bacterium]MDA8941603.1 oligopeptide:H+ symporter [Porticoccaceae bacterium]
MGTPNISDNSNHEKTIMGHPRGLVILFLTEMWERFSYYGMRGLLVVYLTQHFLFSDEKSSLLYGAYTALVYVMTIIGGSLADRYLGARKAVTFGAILLTLGHFGMTFEGSGSKQILSYNESQYQIALDGRGGDAKQQIITDSGKSYVTFTETDMVIAEPEVVDLPDVISRDDFSMSVETEEGYLNMLYLSLALLIAGVGFLKANISTIVGSLYGFGDARRDSGFTIFYMGINMGAFLASIFCGYLGIVHGWKYGFGLAGIGMLIGLLVFLSCQSWLEGKAEPPSMEKLKEKVFLFINVEWMCYMVGFAIIAVSMFLVMNEELVGGILGPIGIVMMLGMIGYSMLQLQGDERSRMLAAIYFILAQIPFWALFEQAGSSLNLLTARLVDREIFGWSVPGPVFQSLNAGYIFMFAPLVAWLWIWLAKRDLNPSTPIKFALGVALAGLGFLALVAGMKGSGEVGLTPVIFIFLIYWIHTMGELMVSPVGLSAVTKLAPARIVGMTMGAWFLYSGLSNFLAGVIARTTGAETIGGQMTNVAAAKAGYIEVYSQVGFIAIGISVLMLLISPVITKMMHGAD